MADPSNEQSQQGSDAGSGPLEPSRVDSPLGAGEPAGDSGAKPARQGDPPAAESQEINQTDVDALMQAAGYAQSPGDGVPGGAAPDSGVDTLGRPIDAAVAESAATQPALETAPVGLPVELPDLEIPTDQSIDAKRVSMLNDVSLSVRIELGRTKMLVEDVLALGEGSVVELDKLAGDPVDLYVNGRLIARGEVLVLNDNFFVRVSDVLSNDPNRVTT